MPSFDLRGIKVAKYVNTSGTITYTGGVSCGDAMTVDLQLKYAEGRLYAESTLAEYMKKATGGTISIGVKYLPDDAQKLMYGATASSRSVDSKAVSGLKFTAKDAVSPVGVAFYAPAMVDGVEKYECVFIPRCIFGQPGYTYNTLGENITFSTPTTTGEFMADHSTSQNMLETAICDTQTAAEGWVKAVLSIT